MNNQYTIYTLPRNQILQGDAFSILKTLPSDSIDCCVTSPPYWGLRNYFVEGQLGLEKTPQEYVNKLCDIFDEVKRVLKPEGSLWLNLGDTYNVKSLVQIPSRVSIEMTDRGWKLRNSIIWYKPSCMPSSVTDRYTVDYEILFFFTKSTKYYFKQQLEPWTSSRPSDIKRIGKVMDYDSKHAVDGTSAQHLNQGRFVVGDINNGRNKRCVWRINPQKFRGAHFAVFPEALIESPIDAGCPEYICNKCGKPRIEIKEKLRNIQQLDRVAYKETKKCGDRLNEVNTAPKPDQIEQYKVVGLSDCGCNAGFHSGVVLDPFMGAGTTAVVALKQNKQYLGIELNPDYIRMSEARLEKVEVRA